MTTLVVIAKACVPGRVKTRLHPPYTLQAAARIAAASLADTLAAATATATDRRILYLDGDPDPSWRESFEVIPQLPGPLDERITALFDRLDEPALLIGMDTPQVSPAHLVWPAAEDAVIGMAEDGGFWALGMREPRGDLVRGVAMSRADTGERQLARLRDAGYAVTQLDTLRDVDTATDAVAVAAGIPLSHFARTLADETHDGRAA